jgi:8-oxo-dGTP diphosphatase
VCNDDGAGLVPTIRVVAAALYDSSGSVLIAERPPGKHLAGRWEFPGGKIDAGETEEAALTRELAEELGIAVRRARPLMRLAHDYDDRRIDISLWVVEEFRGEPSGLDGQVLKWVSPAKLHEEDMLKADVPFIAALQRLYNERLRP